jgi:Protein of unknown function (DUF3102)
MSGPAAAATSSDSKPDDAVKEFVGSDAVAEINSLHKDLFEIGKTVLEKAIRIGELLVANKKAVRHGDWLKWIEKHLVFGSVMAQRYMRIFDKKDELRKASSETHLTITDAYALLAKKTDARANGKRTPVDDFGGDTTPVAAAVDGDVGGIISETAAKASGRHKGNGALWDDKPALSHVSHFKIYNPNGGQMPDVAAQVLYDLDLIPGPHPQQMYGALERESRSACTAAKEQRVQAALAAVAEKIAAIETLPEFESFTQFLATQSKRDAKAIVAVLAVRWGIIEAAREQQAVVPTDSDSKQTVAEPDSIDDADGSEVRPKSPLVEELI